MVKKKIETQWFIEPLDEFSNNVIVELLSIMGEVDINISLKHKGGKKPPVYRVPFRAISYLEKSKKTQPIKYRVYDRQGNDGLAQDSEKFLNLKRKKKAKPAEELAGKARKKKQSRPK